MRSGTTLAQLVRRHPSRVETALLAVLAFLPPLLTSRGQVSADTKTYLYLDPGKLLGEATRMWNPNIGNGTVTHQTLGYLWPMGPFFRLGEILSLPDWIAQRLWWGLLVFIAALGTRRLARALGASATAALLAAGFYAFSPYYLQYFARLSGLLLPWVGLPWLMLCVYRARDDTSWKWPAAFALIISTVGTVNATSLVMVGIGPLLWLLADLLTHVSNIKRVLVFACRAGLLCFGVSVWWLTGLLIQGKYGLPILRYTESYETVAKASSVRELLRGLGYWFFYGGDKLGRWVGPSTPYLTRPVMMLAGWALAGIALLSLSLVRSRHKFHFVFVFITSLGIAVGAAPLSNPSPYGRIFDKVVHNESGFALRSTPRAAPIALLILGLALAFGIDRFRELNIGSRWRLRNVVVAFVVATMFVNFCPWFLLRSTTPSILRDNDIPSDWKQAAAALNNDALSRDSLHPARTYEFPGSDFANYTWGGTIDPVTPGIIDGGYIARELVPYGSDATADLLNAFEARIQEGWFEPASLTTYARFISANRLMMRNDLQHERFRTPRPEVLWRIVKGIDGPSTLYVGSDTSTSSYLPIVDNSTYGAVALNSYPNVVAWKLDKSKPVLTTTPLDDVTVLSGSGDGLVDSLASGVLSFQSTVVYRETLRMRRLTQFDDNQSVVVTDSNRKAARRWFSVGSNLGRVERADEIVTHDPTDNRLMPFVADPNAVVSHDSQTVSELVGDVASVSATSFGNGVTYTPEDRPENAVDGDPNTAWRAGVFTTAEHQSITVTLRAPVSVPQITFSQPTTGVTVRRIRKFRVTYDNGPDTKQEHVLGDFAGSVSTVVEAPAEPFRRLTFEVLSDSFGERSDYADAPGIGLAEIGISGVSNKEYLRVPVDSTSPTPTFVFTRRRIDPSTPNRFDPDQELRRIFAISAPADYVVTGVVRFNPFASDQLLAKLVGARNPMTSSKKADGNILATALNARDGDKSTAWISPLDNPAGAVLSGVFGSSGDRRIVLDVRVGPQYSVPSSIVLTTARRSYAIDLPAPDANGHIEAVLGAPLDGPVVQVTVSDIRETTFPDYFSNAPRVLPVAISEIYTASEASRAIYSISPSCRSDILSIDGVNVGVRLIGNAYDMLQGGSAQLELCDGPVRITRGRHSIGPATSNAGPWSAGWNVDRLILAPSQVVGGSSSSASDQTNVTILSSAATSIRAQITINGPSLLAFAESINSGWKATLTTSTESIDLGEPFVVNGYANGWVVPESGVISLEWTPQRRVLPALLISLATVVLCTVLVLRRRRDDACSRSHSGDAPWWIIALLFFFFAGPIAGVCAFIGSFLRPRVSTLIGLLIGGATVGWIVLSQWHYRWPPNLDWPGRFNAVTWFAVAFFAVAGARERTTLNE